MTQSGQQTRQLINELTRLTGCHTPEEAIRQSAGELLHQYFQQFGEPEMPISMDVLSSLRGITRSDLPPVQSEDAELVPDGQGGMMMRVNSDRPETRQRFSIAHEISHTFFPNYTSKGWCRTDARYRLRSNPDDHLEMLCDIGAAELLFPQPWFGKAAASVSDAGGLVDLANSFQGSIEATLRRYAETSPDSLAVVYFRWKLKPTQRSKIGNRNQGSLFGGNPEDDIRNALRLRIEYTIASPSFRDAGLYLPNDKSVENEGPIYQAAVSGQPANDDCHLELGQATGTYRVWAVPVWTSEDDRGPRGESLVAAVLAPVGLPRSARQQTVDRGPVLF